MKVTPLDRIAGYNDSALAPVFGTAHFNDKAFRSVDTGWKWKEPVEGERKTPEEEGNRLAMESMVAMAESKLADGITGMRTVVTAANDEGGAFTSITMTGHAVKLSKKPDTVMRDFRKFVSSAIK